MTYTQLPPNSILTPQEFISEMNKALKPLPFYKEGMVVCSDENGYWLEENGQRTNNSILSEASKLVLKIIA